MSNVIVHVDNRIQGAWLDTSDGALIALHREGPSMQLMRYPKGATFPDIALDISNSAVTLQVGTSPKDCRHQTIDGTLLADALSAALCAIASKG